MHRRHGPLHVNEFCTSYYVQNNYATWHHSWNMRDNQTIQFLWTSFVMGRASSVHKQSCLQDTNTMIICNASCRNDIGKSTSTCIRKSQDSPFNVYYIDIGKSTSTWPGSQFDVDFSYSLSIYRNQNKQCHKAVPANQNSNYNTLV